MYIPVGASEEQLKELLDLWMKKENQVIVFESLLGLLSVLLRTLNKPKRCLTDAKIEYQYLMTLPSSFLTGKARYWGKGGVDFMNKNV